MTSRRVVIPLYLLGLSMIFSKADSHFSGSCFAEQPSWNRPLEGALNHRSQGHELPPPNVAIRGGGGAGGPALSELGLLAVEAPAKERGGLCYSGARINHRREQSTGW